MEIYEADIIYDKTGGLDCLFNSNPTEVRQSHGEVEQTNKEWNSLVVAALSIAESVDPYQSDLPVNSVVRAVDALDWKVGQRGCDVRPASTTSPLGSVGSWTPGPRSQSPVEKLGTK